MFITFSLQNTFNASRRMNGKSSIIIRHSPCLISPKNCSRITSEQKVKIIEIQNLLLSLEVV